LQNKFYDELKKYGYSALLDYNDKYYSSYHARAPIIVFDTKKVKLQSVMNMSDDDISKVYKQFIPRIFVRMGQETLNQSIVGKVGKAIKTPVNIINTSVYNKFVDYLTK
jgi:hypothetical protein